MNEKDEFIAEFAIKNHYVSPDTLDFIKTRQTILQTNGQELNLEEELLKQNLLTQEQLQYINQEYMRDHSVIKEKTSSVSRHEKSQHDINQNEISQHEKSQHDISRHDISQYEKSESQTILEKLNTISETLSEHTKRSTIKNIEELYPKTEVTLHKGLMQQHISKLETMRRYNLIEQRGHGGMGVVYKAFDTILKRNVAIKLLLPQEGNTPIQFQRFLIEAQAAAKLNHPNIVAVYDIAQLDAENFYLVMEYIEGKSLADIIAERAPLSLAESIEIIWQTTLALQEAHFHNIVHRDIKPGNILITPNNLVKVTDFGLAKILSETSMVSLSASGQFLGTPHYVAPEQIDGKNIDGRADLYALGVTFYQMLTKHFPFESKDIYSLIFSRLKNPPTPIEVYRRDIPESIEKIIQKLLESNLENRYANATELLDDLNEAIQEDSRLDILNEQNQSRIITYIPKKYKKQNKGHKLELLFIFLFALSGILAGYFAPVYSTASSSMRWKFFVRQTRRINQWVQDRFNIKNGLSRLFLPNFGFQNKGTENQLNKNIQQPKVIEKVINTQNNLQQQMQEVYFSINAPYITKNLAFFNEKDTIISMESTFDADITCNGKIPKDTHKINIVNEFLELSIDIDSLNTQQWKQFSWDKINAEKYQEYFENKSEEESIQELLNCLEKLLKYPSTRKLLAKSEAKKYSIEKLENRLSEQMIMEIVENNDQMKIKLLKDLKELQ